MRAEVRWHVTDGMLVGRHGCQQGGSRRRRQSLWNQTVGLPCLLGWFDASAGQRREFIRLRRCDGKQADVLARNVPEIA